MAASLAARRSGRVQLRFGVTQFHQLHPGASGCLGIREGSGVEGDQRGSTILHAAAHDCKVHFDQPRLCRLGAFHLDEFVKKYKEGTIIADTPTNRRDLGDDQIGKPMEGEMVLEVPEQIDDVPPEIIKRADELGITIRDENGKEYKLDDEYRSGPADDADGAPGDGDGPGDGGAPGDGGEPGAD